MHPVLAHRPHGSCFTPSATSGPTHDGPLCPEAFPHLSSQRCSLSLIPQMHPEHPSLPLKKYSFCYVGKAE